MNPEKGYHKMRKDEDLLCGAGLLLSDPGAGQGRQLAEGSAEAYRGECAFLLSLSLPLVSLWPSESRGREPGDTYDIFYYR